MARCACAPRRMLSIAFGSRCYCPCRRALLPGKTWSRHAVGAPGRRKVGWSLVFLLGATIRADYERVSPVHKAEINKFTFSGHFYTTVMGCLGSFGLRATSPLLNF